MDEDHVNEWVQKKLDRGISPERIKKTLEKSGRDPSIVDKVKSGDEEPFEEVDSSEGGEDPFDSLKYVEDEEQSKDTENRGEVGESSSSVPSVSLPEVPSFSLPATDLSAKKLAPVFAVLLLAGVGYTGMNIMDGGSAVDSVLNSCEESNVDVMSVGESGGQTIAEVSVPESSEVQMDVYSGEEKMGENIETLNGRGIIRVDATGDRAVFYEAGCAESPVEQTY